MRNYIFAFLVSAIIQPQIGLLLWASLPTAFLMTKSSDNDSINIVLIFVFGLVVDIFGGTLLGLTSICLLAQAFLVSMLGGYLKNSLWLTSLVGIVSGVVFWYVIRFIAL